MARLWHSGFGLNSTTGSMEFSSISAGVTIQTTTVRIGPYAMRANPSAATQFVRFHGFATDQSIVGYQRFYLRIATAPGANATICRFVNTSNAQCAGIRLTSSSTLVLLDAADNAIGSASSALSANTWYMVELGLDASSSPGTVTARLNGTQFATGANSSQATWSRFLIGPVVSATCDLYFADWAVNDTTGSAQTSWPGEGVVLTLSPNAAGDANQWNNTSNAAGSSNNYQLVDEIPPNDATDYVQHDTLNTEDMYNVAASGIGASDTVNVVTVGLRYRNSTADASAAVKVQAKKTSGGTVSQGASLIANATSFRTNRQNEPRTYPLTMHTDPDGSAWTSSTVDSMQIGVKITTEGAQRIQVSAVWAVVDYTPSTGTSASAGNASGTGTANTPSASVKPSAGVAAASAAAQPAFGGHIYEDFESYPTSTNWAEGSSYHTWSVEFLGTAGQVVPVDVGGEGRVLQLEAHDNASTSASLVVANKTTSGDVGYRVRMRTAAQLRTPTPNPWEVAWFVWNYTEPSSDVRRFYYIALKTNGFELGKVDQSISFAGGQRFLWTDSTAHSVGTWYDVVIRQQGSNIRVWVDGTLRADFTDGPGSGGTPAWGTSGETVMTSGAVGLYHEDARAQFGSVMWEWPTGYATGTGTANNPQAATGPSGGHAAGTGTALNPQAMVAATAAATSGTGTANDATVTAGSANTDVNAGAASGTGVANNAVGSAAPTAGAASGSGAANTPSVAVSPHAGASAGTGSAGDPSVITAVAASAQAASGTGTAVAAVATTAVVAAPSAAAATAAAGNATTRIDPTSQAASGTGTANSPSASCAVSSGAAAGVGAAGDATVLTGALGLAEAAAGTAAATDATIRIAPVVQAATGTAAAHDAAAVTGTVAPAGLASGTGAGHNAVATTAVSAAAGAATGAGAAGAITALVAIQAQAASAAGSAGDASGRVSATGGAASGAGAANDAAAVTGAVASAGVASGTAVAGDVTAKAAPVVGSASASGTASPPAVATAPTSQPASGTGTASNATVRVSTGITATSGVGTALDARSSVSPTPSAASASGLAGNSTPGVAATAQPASGSGAASGPAGLLGPAAGSAAGVGSGLDASVTTFTGAMALAGVASGSGAGLDPSVLALSRAVRHVNGWVQLLEVLRDASEEARLVASQPPAACPNDGEPLREGSGGQLFCSFDGWRPDGSHVPESAEHSGPPPMSPSLFVDTEDPWF